MPVFSLKGVCSTALSFDIDDKKCVRNVHFTGGCDGNAKGIARLVDGMPASEVVERLEGICCGKKSTSCPDQLAKHIELALNDETLLHQQTLSPFGAAPLLPFATKTPTIAKSN